MAERKKASPASETLPKEQRKRATAANRHLDALDTKLASVKATNLQMEEIATRSEAKTNRARTNLRDAQARLFGAEQEAKLACEDQDKIREQSAKSAKAAEESLRQLAEVSTRAQGSEAAVKCLESQISKVGKVRDVANRFADEKAQQARTLESRIALQKEELYFLKQKETTECYIKIVVQKVVDAESEITKLTDGLSCGIFK